MIMLDSLKEIKELKEKSKALLAEISRYEDLEDMERRNLFCHKSLYGNLYFKRIPLSFINTVFYTHTNILLPHINCTFEDSIIEPILSSIPKNKSMQLSFAMLCVAVTNSKHGPILLLEEPFKTLQTKPLKKTPYKLAQNWIDRILIVDLLINSEAKKSHEFQVKRIKILNLTKSGIIKCGIEYPFAWGDVTTQLNDSNKYQSFKIDKRVLETYKDVTGKSDCLNALHIINDTFSSKLLIPPFRQNENTLWIRFEYEAVGIIIHNNRLEMIYQPSSHINDLFNPDGSLSVCNTIFDFIGNSQYNGLSDEEYMKQKKIDACRIRSDSYADLIKASCQ